MTAFFDRLKANPPGGPAALPAQPAPLLQVAPDSGVGSGQGSGGAKPTGKRKREASNEAAGQEGAAAECAAGNGSGNKGKENKQKGGKSGERGGMRVTADTTNHSELIVAIGVVKYTPTARDCWRPHMRLLDRRALQLIVLVAMAAGKRAKKTRRSQMRQAVWFWPCLKLA